MYAYLQAYVKAPEFLAKLVAARASSPEEPSTVPATPAGADVRQPEWWESPTEPSAPGEGSVEGPEDAEDGFSQVSRCVKPS